MTFLIDAELATLREMADDLASGRRDEAELLGVPGSDVPLIFRVADRDTGARRTPLPTRH